MSEQQFHDCLKHAARRQADSSFFVTGLQTSIRNFCVCVREDSGVEPVGRIMHTGLSGFAGKVEIAPKQFW